MLRNLLASVRSILGASKLDRLPKDELSDVIYISGTINKRTNEIKYRRTKEVRHTHDSFPLLNNFKQSEMTFLLGYNLGRFLYLPLSYRPKLIWLIQVWMSLIITAAATSFPWLIPQ